MSEIPYYPPIMPTWTVEATDKEMRLDHFLTREMTDLTRSSIQKSIKYGKVTINNKIASVHQFLKTGNIIVWNEEAVSLRRPLIKKEVLLPRIIKETADWLVVEKPRGLLTHPSSSSDEATLVDWFLDHVPSATKVGEDPSRPGIVHRLDRDVSGLMVIAKTQAAFDALKEAFAQRTVEKKYLAMVHGEISKEEDEIKLRIARSSSKPRMAARPPKDGGKAAWTHYRVLERFVGATLVDVEILSGRTHQIRAHFHGIGHPIMGDSIYTRKQTDRNIKPPCLLLQSVHLAFNDPTSGERQVFDLTPDPAFDVVREQLLSHHS